MTETTERKNDIAAGESEKSGGWPTGHKNSGGVQVNEVLYVQVTPQQEARLVWKIDRHIMPLMGFCYMLQYMDKVSLGFSTQLGLRSDLGLIGSQYSWASSVFYFGYLFWSWPSSYLSVRFPLGKYLAVSVGLWGIVLMCHGATHNFAGIFVARFFLGVTEAAVAPGFSLITAIFYKRSEHASRMCLWFVGNAMANLISGLVAYGIGNIHSYIKTWRLLFLILGALTIAYSIVLGIFLPDSPSKAKFLTSEEKAVALHRTLENKTGIMDEEEFKADQMLEAFRDPQAWLLFCFTLCQNIPNGGLSSFSSILINGFGFSPLNSLLVQMPSGVGQLISLGCIAMVTKYVRNSRVPTMITLLSVSLVGMIILYVLPDTNPWGRMVGFWLASPFATTIPLSLSLIATNVGGFTKKATVSAMLFVAYSTGNILGPQFFLASESPSYPTGIKAVLSGFSLAIFFLACLLAYYYFENRRRELKFGLEPQNSVMEYVPEALLSQTDRRLKGFRYTL